MDKVYSKMSTRSYDISYCDKLSYASGVERCYGSFAGWVNDVSICEGDFEFDKWREWCYWRVFLKSRDRSLCEKAGTYQDDCENWDFSYAD